MRLYNWDNLITVTCFKVMSLCICELIGCTHWSVHIVNWAHTGLKLLLIKERPTRRQKQKRNGDQLEAWVSWNVMLNPWSPSPDTPQAGLYWNTWRLMVNTHCSELSNSRGTRWVVVFYLLIKIISVDLNSKDTDVKGRPIRLGLIGRLIEVVISTSV